MIFTFIKNIILNGQYNIYTYKQKDICDYNPICIMSSGFIFDDIIMILSRNKEVNQHLEVIDSYFT